MKYYYAGNTVKPITLPNGDVKLLVPKTTVELPDGCNVAKIVNLRPARFNAKDVISYMESKIAKKKEKIKKTVEDFVNVKGLPFLDAFSEEKNKPKTVKSTKKQ